MNKIILLSIFTFLFVSCDSGSKSNEGSAQNKSTSVSESLGLRNYAVVWEWTTNEKQLVEDNLVAINEEITDLWKNEKLENAYWNNESKDNKLANYPNIIYFLKAESLNKAERILNDLVIVQKNIASYTIYPVGTKWLGRNTEVINKRTITNSYAAVWSNEKVLDPNLNDSLIQEQSEKILNLFEKGTVENVYWDFENTYSIENSNGISDFAFFVNVNTEKEARELCDDLPFSKQNFVSYKLFPVGVFWMGEYKELQ